MNKIALTLCSIATALALSACSGEQAAPASATPASTSSAPAGAAATASGAVASPAALSPEDQIKEREKSMKAMGKASKVLRAMAEGKESFDAAKMQEAVAILNTHANQGWEHFDVATKDLKSEALPAVWEKNDQFQQEIKTFQASVAELNTAAGQGTLDAVKAPLGKVGESCKSCHTAFKAD